jgi:hypothetical protein
LCHIPHSSGEIQYSCLDCHSDRPDHFVNINCATCHSFTS